MHKNKKQEGFVTLILVLAVVLVGAVAVAFVRVKARQ